MEATEAPSGGSPLWAKITGIQFGLMTSTDIRTMSVAVDPEGSAKPKDRMNAHLGLPTASGPCLTCQGITVDQCQGHFGHIQLPLPIFHPNHVETLVQVLRKICLNCGKLRKKNKSSLALKAPPEQNTNGNVTEGCNNQPKKRNRTSTSEASDRGYKGLSSTADAKNKQKVEDVSDEDVDWPDDSQHNVVVLSSSDSDETMHGKPKHVQGEDVRKRSGQLTSQRAEEFPANSEKNTRKRKFSSDFTEFSSKSSTKFLASSGVAKGSVSESKRTGKFPKQADKIAKNAKKFGDIPKPPGGNCRSSLKVCKYCSASSRRLGYPDLVIRVHVTSGGTSGEDPLNLVKVIKMRVNPKDQENLAVDFWAFVEGSSKSQNTKSSRYLLPSEALTILKRIPEKNLSALGMNANVARPEALILECIPIPPNCTRLQDYAFGPSGTNIGFKMGVDRATQTFERLLRKINSINTSRFSKPAFQAALMECSVLQALFQHYLREKGAPKAAPGKEKKKVDNSGRLQKRASRWSLEWLKENIIGKRSGFSARNVVTGDPYLSVEEVGIPLDIAKHVTCSERVTEFNRSILQNYIQIGQELGNSRACGAVRIVRDGERREVTRKTGIELEIGDIVHRHLKDGDLVFINRPPSLHKHSLLALKARIHTEATWTINPAICAPLHADFDGDCLHLFVPQTEDSKAELHQLMTLPAHILPSPDESTILTLSQDYVLASYLVTSSESPVFVTKEEMHQLGSWTTRRIPVPAVVKSPKGGPLWTGTQVIDLTIPENLSFQSSNKATIIQDGELISCGEKPNWLASTKGLVRIAALHHADAAVKHIDCSQSVLREWLLTHGFSVSLEDFFAAPDHFQRRKLKQEMEDSLEYAKCMAVGKQLIFDKRIQAEDKLQSRSSFTSPSRASGSSTTIHDIDLENVAITCFQQSQSQIVETMVESISDSNSLLAMLRSGSKGSSAKVMQQIGSLGIQVTGGDKLLSTNKNPKLVALAKAMGYSFDSDSELQDIWETRGLVKSSLLDGLEPDEFFTHAISVRDGIFRQSQEIAGPGELFKRLMLFLRDVHVAYDGTVRNRGNLEIIQFQYEGAKSLTEEDASMNTKETVMPGEAVGILAATAFSQPAYQIMLEASPGVGSRKVRPFALLQESMYPRSKGKLKASDRRSILRLSRCECDKKYCEERRILDLQAELQPMTLKMLATATAVEYASESSERWETFDFGARNINQTQLLPWIGHLQLDKMVLFEKKITPGMILERLEANDKVIKAVSRRCRVGGIIFCFRHLGDCDLMTKEDHGKASEELANGLCLHFSLLRSLKRKRRNLKTVKHIDDETAEMLKIIQSAIIPMFLSTVIKGCEKIERTNILWEDEAWSPPRIWAENDNFSAKSDGELVLEVTVKEALCTRRGMPWNITQDSCLKMMDHVDWQRSSPYSIQEIRTIFGVVAAHNVLEERFELAAGQYIGKKHIKLVAELMAHSGEIHGLTSHGYRDWMRSLRITAPLTAGVFRAPMKHFMEAGRKGMTESFKGVLASSVFGKTVPVGTGAEFKVNLSVTPHLNKGLSIPLDSSWSAGEDSAQSIDILERLIHLNSKIAIEYPRVTSSTHEPQESNVYDTAQVECLWGSTGKISPSEVEGEWGSRADGLNGIPIEASGSWAVDEKDPNQTDALGTNNENSQWGTENGETNKEGGGWGGFDNRSEKSPTVPSGSFGVKEQDTNQTDALRSSDRNSHWGTQDLVTKAEGGWGSLEAETTNPSGNCAAEERDTNNQTNAWGAGDGTVQWVVQNVVTAAEGVWGSTEVETSNPSGNWE